MCSPLDPLSCPDAIVRGIVGGAVEVATTVATNSLATVLSGLTDQMHSAIKLLSITLAGWILVPSTNVCPDEGADWVAACATAASPAAQVRGWLLPITALVAVIGIVWQGITMTITRKGEPLLTVLKGLFAVGLWGVVGIAGTQLALRAGDAYAVWVLRQAIFGDSLNPTEDLGEAIASMSAGQSYAAVLVLLLLQIPFLVATLAQILLMIFREGAVIVLAGQLQLAAAGGLTRLTSGWLAKVTGWTLALIAYKPIAATIYAVAFALMGDGTRNLLMGVAVMIMAVIAMPALMRLFNWGVGTVGNANHNTLRMLGTSLAAGLHAGSVARGLGGYGPAEHARFLDSHGPGPSGAGPAGSGGGGGGPVGGPSGAGVGGPSGAGVGAPAGPSAFAAGGSSGSGASAAAGSAGAGAAAAASGGVSVAADAAVQAAGQVRQRVHRAADAAGDAMRGGQP